MKTVAIYFSPRHNAFIHTCRDVSRCTGWDEDGEFVWPTEKPSFKMKVLFKGAERDAEAVRTCYRASMRSAGVKELSIREMADLVV